MAVCDHPREPALERAMPADVGPGPMFFEDTEAEVLLRDGSWVWCKVIGQRKDRHGRWCVGIRYYPSSTIGESGGWYLYDPGCLRRLTGSLMHLAAGYERACRSTGHRLGCRA
jgi:hypothetical protein